MRKAALAAVLPVLFIQVCAAQEITIAAAADLQSAMQEIASQFEKDTGKLVTVTFGSSGNFFQQIQSGAPFDIFFSADLDYAKKLDEAGFTLPGSYYEYARGKIVIWARNDSKINLNSGLVALLDPEVKKIAIANPLHAPYGQAAVSAMQNAGIYEKVKHKLVLGENISQTASFIMSGAADIGIVALSLAISPNVKHVGHYVEVATDEYPPIEQAGVILKASKNQEAAKQFLSFVKSAAIAEVLERYGFDAPNRLAK